MKKAVLILSLLVFGLYLLLHTVYGLHLIMKFSPDEFNALVRDGNLANGFVLEKVDYRSDGLEIVIDEVTTDWSLYSLLTGRFIVDDINIQNMVVTTTDSGDSSAPEMRFSLPVQFTLNRFVIEGLTVVNNTASTSNKIDTIRLAMESDGQLIRIRQFAAESEAYNAVISGSVNLDSVMTHHLEIAWHYRVDDTLEFNGSTMVDGDLQRTTVNTALTSPVAGDINLTMNDLVGELGWETRISAAAVSLAGYTGELLSREIDLLITGSGTLTNAKLEGSFTPATTAYEISGDYGLDFSVVSFALTMDEMLSDTPLAVVRLGWEDVSLESADNTTVFTMANGQLSADYQNNRYTLEAGSSFSYNDLTTGSWQISGAGDSNSVTIDTIRIDTEQGQLAGNGAVTRVGEEITLDSSLDWENMVLPVGESVLALSGGNLSLAGDLDDFSLHVTTDVSLDQSHLLKLELVSSGNSEQLTLDTMTLALADGELHMPGRINWADGINVDLALSGEGLNPAIYHPEWPGRLELQAGIQAVIHSADDFTLEINTLALSGELRELPIQLDLSSVITPDLVTFQDAMLTSGASSIEVDGSWGQNMDLNWDMYAPDMAMLHPRISGQMGGAGKFAGTLDNPEMTGAIEFRNIESPWIQVGKFYSVFDINQDSSDEIDLLLDIENVIYNTHQLSSLYLSASGTSLDHIYELDISADNLDAYMAGEATYQEARWSGETAELEIIPATFGNWTIIDPFTIAVEAGAVDVRNLCLEQEAAAVCTDGSWEQSTGWEAAVSATELPISLVNAYLPEHIAADGSLTLGFTAGKTTGEQLAVGGDLVTTDGEISFTTADGQQQSFGLNISEGGFTLSDGTIESNLLVETGFSNNQPLTGRLTITGMGEDFSNLQESDIDAELKWVLDDLSFISTISPRVVDVNGALDLDLAIAGKVSTPEITGKLMLTDASFMLPEAGIEITDIHIDGASTNTGGYELTGTASSGEGELQLTANIYELPDMIHAGITGKRVEIINLPEIRSLATPDIQLELTPDRTTISGMVEISDTLIDLDEMRNTATLSEDVVFTGESDAVPAREQTRTDTRLRIRLAENIRIQGQGITGRLTGNLEIYSTERGEMLGKGEISILEGKFAAYGQSLQIEQGRLIYSNNQLDNPELRITAVRHISGGDITAGIQVSGYLSNPVIELFSNQALNDDEILAYIVFGRPINTLTSGEGADLVGAATAMGLRNSGFITKKLSSTFSLDELQLSSDPGGENASLQVGKYLTPKLYISYVMGLFENFSTAKIRYDINNSWSLEAKSGEDVSVDLYYSIGK